MITTINAEQQIAWLGNKLLKAGGLLLGQTVVFLKLLIFTCYIVGIVFAMYLLYFNNISIICLNDALYLLRFTHDAFN